MTQIIELVDRYSLTKIKDIEVLGEPSVYIEDNGAHTFDFQCSLKHKNDFSAHVVLLVEGQYYLITKAKKRRNEDVELSVECEHISYELLDAWDNNEVTEGDAHSIIGEYLQHTRFNLISTIPHETFMYKPSTLEVRTRILEIADVIGGHVVFDNFDIYIRDRLGSNKGLKVELGVNLLAIEQEIDYTNASSPASYYIDMVDLSSVPGYDDTETIELGDTIEIVDGELGISTSEDILAIEYNPFQPQLPKISIGRYAPSFSEYIEEMEEEKEGDDDNKTMLQSFKVGDIDCLKLDSIDETSAVIDYITNTAVQGIDANEVVELSGNKTGVSASIDSQYSGYILTALITSETENGKTTTQYVMPNASLNTLSVPGNNESVSVTIVVTKIPFADLMSNPSAFEGETPPFIEAYGVKFIINNNADGFLESFQVGDVDCLSLGESIDETGQIISYMKGTVSNPVAGEVYKTYEQLKGINAKLKEKVKGHHLTLIHSVRGTGEEGTWTHTTRTMPIANARDFEVPTNEDDSVILVITKEPFDSIKNGTVNVDETFIVAFGVRFTEEEILSDDTYRMEFGICDLGGMMTFDFEYKDGYGEVESITTGIIGDNSTSGDIKLVTKAEKTGDKYKRIKIFAIIGDGVNLETTKVSIQAVCYTGTHEVMG